MAMDAAKLPLSCMAKGSYGLFVDGLWGDMDLLTGVGSFAIESAVGAMLGGVPFVGDDLTQWAGVKTPQERLKQGLAVAARTSRSISSYLKTPEGHKSLDTMICYGIDSQFRQAADLKMLQGFTQWMVNQTPQAASVFARTPCNEVAAMVCEVGGWVGYEIIADSLIGMAAGGVSATGVGAAAGAGLVAGKVAVTLGKVMKKSVDLAAALLKWILKFLPQNQMVEFLGTIKKSMGPVDFKALRSALLSEPAELTGSLPKIATVSHSRQWESLVPQESGSIQHDILLGARAYMRREPDPSVVAGLTPSWQKIESKSKSIGSITPERKAEVDQMRMEVSGTASGLSPRRSGSPAQAVENWKVADELIAEWAKAKEPITLERIKELNWVLGDQLPNNGGTPGQFRSLGQDVAAGGQFSKLYVPGQFAEEEMYRFMKWYEQAEKAGLPPIQLAAQSYQKLVSIHPFMDGNGRTTRMVMDWILQKHGLPPATLVGEEEVNVAVFGLQAFSAEGILKSPPEAAIRAVTSGVERTIRIYETGHP